MEISTSDRPRPRSTSPAAALLPPCRLTPTSAVARGINKIGTGILYLAGTNFFTGAINVSGGSVKVDGPLNAALILGVGGSVSLDSNPSAGILVRNLNTLSLSAATAPFPQLNLLPASNRSNRQLVVTSGLSIAGSSNAWRGIVDLSNNDMDVQNGSLSTLTSQLREGYNAGHWNGSGGIISTTAAADTTHLNTIGIIENNQRRRRAVHLKQNRLIHPHPVPAMSC